MRLYPTHMASATVHSKATEGSIRAALRGALTQAQARRLANENPEVLAFALLAASKRIAELQGLSQAQGLSPSTPSGMVPIYTKPNTPKLRKKPGARKGHPGHRRETPERIDEHKTHRLKQCPCCGGRLQRCQRSRTRIIEDIPEEIHPVVTEHTIHRDYCPKCKKHVEPVVPDALPHATIGHHMNALTSWLHYGLGVTIDQIVDILGYHLQTKLTPGGLIDGWRRLSELLLAWYEQIAEAAKNSAHLHARKRPDFAPGKFESRVDRLNARLAKLAGEEHIDGDTQRLTKRLRRYAEFIFTFLDYPDVPHDNNFGERQIRPAVILRKNSQSNRSDRGAATQAVLMSVYRTLKLRGLNPTKTIADALKTYLSTGQLPPLPE